MKTFNVRKIVTFYDCDPAGIIFFSRVFEFAHSAYEQLIKSIPMDEDFWNNDEYVVPIIKSESTYLKPIKYGDEIIVSVRVSELRSSSFELDYKMADASGEHLSSVKTVHVFVDKKSWKKIELPQHITEGLKKYLS